MCNLYSVTKGQQAIRDAAKAMRDVAGNLPLLSGVFPDMAAPLVRVAADGVRELTQARWGMPSPAVALQGRKVDRGVTNIRNTASPHWRRWLSPPSRCLVPFTSFSESAPGAGGKPEPVWFALSADRQLGFFAGLWTRWTCTRKLAEGEITCDLFGFLTTEPNAEVGAVHPKAMPVILTRLEDFDIWLNAPWAEAAQLQRPLADGALAVVACGAGEDGRAAVQNRASGQASLIFP
jgi:putative SOS response-associated peptidase YedK